MRKQIKKSNRRLALASGIMVVEEGKMSAFLEGAPHAVTQEVFSPAVTMNPTTFDGQSEEALALRFSRKPRLRPNLTIEFTRDAALIHQYFRIYHSECRIIPEFLDAEEEYNRKSHIMIVREGNVVVGGARLYVNTPRLQRKLLLELAGFNIHEHFPQLEQQQMRYAELSRLALLPDFRGLEALRDIFVNISRKCVALDIDIFFAAAPLLNVRSYRQICKSIGFKEAIVHTDIDIPRDPGFEEVKDYLLSVKRERSIDKMLLECDSATWRAYMQQGEKATENS